jgi:hypothetical protein
VKRGRNQKLSLVAQLILAFIVAVTAVLLWLFVKSLSSAAEKDRMVVPVPPQASSDRVKIPDLICNPIAIVRGLTLRGWPQFP